MIKDCRLCIHWTGKCYCEKSYYILDTKNASACKEYYELADELVRLAKEQGIK